MFVSTLVRRPAASRWHRSVARALGASLLTTIGASDSLAQIQSPLGCQGLPDACGQWSDVYHWCAQLSPSTPVPPTGCNWSTIGHAALIPTGNQRGRVLLWNVLSSSVGGACEFTKKSYLFDPASPTQLIEIIHPELASNVFCSGLSWDPDGNLIVVGGEEIHGGAFPAKTYRFLSGALGTTSPGSPPTVTPAGRLWVELGEMGIPRNYPTVVPLLRLGFAAAATNCSASLPPYAGGGAFVLGGRPSYTDGNETWDFLNVGATVWSCTLRPANPLTPASYPHAYVDHTLIQPLLPALTNVYDPKKAAGDPVAEYPEVDLESYPRASQLDTGEVVIVGDRDKLGGTPSGAVNGPGDVWIVRPHLASLPVSGWELRRGEEGPSGLDRQWDNAVIMHMWNPTDPIQPFRKNRILVFGGSDESPLTPAAGTLDSVEEYEHGATPVPLWHPKQAINGDRWTLSAVLLPTGMIFIHGGESLHTSGGGPVFTPCLYDPGRTPTGAQDPPWPLEMPSVVPGGTCHSPASGRTPRVQHHVALLLPDARVFVAGSDSVSGYPEGKFTAEVFEPPYLHRGFRPVIIAAPPAASFSSASGGTQTFTVTAQLSAHGNTLRRVVLLRPGAVTHQYDNDQRYIELEFSSTPVLPPTTPPSVSLQVNAPDEGLGPPGYYMLFLVEERSSDLALAPSLAAFIDLN